MCLEALSCVWAISAHEENKPLVVLHGRPSCKTVPHVPNLSCLGGVDAVMNAFHKIKNEKGHPLWADFLQTMSAIVQNVCESHYDSGKRNELQGVLINKGVLDFLQFMIVERTFRKREDQSDELECIKFLLCLTIGNLAFNRTNRFVTEDFNVGGRCINDLDFHAGPY